MSYLSRTSPSNSSPLSGSSRFNSSREIKQPTGKTNPIAPTFHKKPSIRHEEEGKRLFFECLVEAEPEPQVKWFHNGRPLAESSTIKAKLIPEGASFYRACLEITEVNSEHAGVYTVSCRNPSGELSAKISLNFDQESVVEQDDDDDEPGGIKGSTIQTRAQSTTSDFDRRSSDSNVTGSGKKPSFLERPVIKQSSDFKNVQFDCRVQADPKPVIQWLHKGNELRMIPGRMEAELTLERESPPAYLARLMLRGVDHTQTGDYKCVVTNSLGTCFASINLNFVQGRTGLDSGDGRSPRFPKRPTIRQVGGVLTIECIVESTPKPEITWFHGQDNMIKEEARHSHCKWYISGPITDESELKRLGVISSDPSTGEPRRLTSVSGRRGDIYIVCLDIKKPKASDGGIYRCNASNVHGDSSANIALNFQANQEEGREDEPEEKDRKVRRNSALRKSSVQMVEEEGEEEKSQRLRNEEQKPPAGKQVRRDSQEFTGGGSGASGSASSAAEKKSRLDESLAAYQARRRSSAMSQQEPLNATNNNNNREQPMEVEEQGRRGSSNVKPLSSLENTNNNNNNNKDNELDSQQAPKRTLSTSSRQSDDGSGRPRRIVSVKKKRPSLLSAGEPETEELGNLGDPESDSRRSSLASSVAGGDPVDPTAAPKRRLVVKKRVSVKRDAKLKDIAEQPAIAASLGPPEVAVQQPVEEEEARENRQQSRQLGGRQDRIPSVAVEAPGDEEGGVTAPYGSSRDRKSSSGLQSKPRISISSNEDKSLDQQSNNNNNNKQQQRRGTYDGLRGEPIEEDQLDEEAKRYLASRGGLGPGGRTSSSSGQQQAPGGGLLQPVGQRGQRDSSPANSKEGSPSGRRGSGLLGAELGAATDQRRPSIILAGENKLRPGEIMDRRRRSSIDVRRASALEVDAADRPSTPLKPCGRKPAIIDFQDNVSGLENHTSYLTFGVEGDPVPTLRFFKGDSEIYDGGRYSVVTDGETNTCHFCIRKSKPMDEARYKVIATNEHGEDTAYMQLFVSDESGMDFRAMLRHRQYAKWKKDQDDPNWGNLKAVEEERLAQIKDPKRPDNFIKPLQNQKVKQGRELKVRFECVFSKSGVKAKWFRNNKEIFPNNKFHLNSTGDLHVLEIDAPHMEDAGRYTCQCLDTKCSAQLEVEEPQPVYKFTKVLAKGYGQHLNRELVLECCANSHKAQVAWFKNDPQCRGEPLKGVTGSASTGGEKYCFDMDKYGKKILRIRGCQLDDSGEYTCKIINTPLENETTTTQACISEKKFQIMKPLYSQRATEDDRVVLECEVDEYDAPVRWFRKDRETGQWKELKPEALKSKEIQVEGKKRRLVIKKAKCQDEAEYKCCTNADETVGELFVEPANKWRRKLVDVTVVEDEPLVLEVELMERKPGVATIWARNRREVGQQGGSMQTTADERIQFKTEGDKMQLRIEQAKLDDAGDWSATFNKMKCSCKVTVLPAEKAPQMSFPVGPIQAEVGKARQIEIPFQVSGTRQSPVEAKLMLKGELVPKDKVEIIVKDDKVLIKFKDPQRADSSDQYEFVLENAKGKQAHKFKVDVQGPPGPPEGPLKITDVFKDRCKLKWERPLDDGGSPIAHYVVERQEVGSGRSTWTECGLTSTCELDVNDLGGSKKEYRFRVRAVNKKGKSEPLVASKTIVAKDPYDPPSEPENLVLVNWDKDFVDLQWEAPAKDGGVPVEHYVIESRGKFGNEWLPMEKIPAAAGCKAHLVEGLKEGAELQFRVRAVNQMGPGEPSNSTKPVKLKARFVRPYLLGDGLKNLVVKKGRPVRYEVQFNAEPAPEIEWLANGQALRCITDKCEIENSMEQKRTILLVTNTTRADSGRYKLVLRNSCGEFATEADVVVLDKPAPPEGPLFVEEVRADQVTIKWRKPKDSGGEPLDGYVIEKMNLETGRWVPAGECGPGEESFCVKNLMKGKKYKFRVRAKNKEGESDPLETNNVLNVGEEPTIQKCPARVQVAQGDTAKIKIHFAGEPEEIRITNMDTGEVVQEAGSGGASRSDPKYTVFDDYLTISIPEAQKDRHAGRYKVELKNKIGAVDASFQLDVAGPPSAPLGPLETGQVTENSVQLSWRPPADDGGSKVTHYVVERRDTSQGPDAWIEVSDNCKETSFNVSGLSKDQAYEFRVSAVNENGQSKPLITEKPVLAKLPFDRPQPPGRPEATPLSEDSVRLEWTKPISDGGSRILGYLVEKREVGSDTWQKVNLGTSGSSPLSAVAMAAAASASGPGGSPTSGGGGGGAGGPGTPSATAAAQFPSGLCLGTDCVVKNLIEDRKYEFRVVAVNAAGPSDPSLASAATLVRDPNAGGVPQFVSGLRKVVGVEGGSFELECIVEGQPSPTVVWSKGGRELRDGASSKYCATQESGPNGTTIHRLLVSRASAEDADEFSIKATNKAGSKTSRCDVEIQTKPHIIVPARLAGEAPVVFDRGESIQLKIPYGGNPTPEVHWFKDDEEIEPPGAGQLEISADGRQTVLTIRDASREDSGKYRLLVKNKLGEAEASFNVSVADRPEAPRFLQVTGDPADDAVQLSWKAPLWDGGSQITQYVIEKRELPMQSWIRAGTTRFLSHQVVNLNEEKQYEFRVFAENIYGQSDPSQLAACTTKPSSRKRAKHQWPIDPATGKKIRTTPGMGDDNLSPTDYDKFVKDGPACHVPTDIKSCPITDNYEILERIGEGVFGEVYRVREKSTGDYYAAKFTPVSSHEAKALLKKDIDTVNLLHHKNILRLHDAYEDDDEMVTVHEFISGPELLEKPLLEEPGYQMTEEQVRKYMKDICEAVRHMHDRNVIHLDLKPENLVLQSNKPLSAEHEPKVKIVDFGLACKLDPHEVCKISTNASDYVAPEILEKDSVGFYTDMWAVGVLAYVLLSGSTPFSSQSETKSCEWSFDKEPVFSQVSAEGRDFIEKLLVRQKEKRMTAHECLEHPWLREAGDEETRRKRREPLAEASAYRRERDAMRKRYLDWWPKSKLPIGHISNYGPLRKLYADRYKIYEALIDRRELAPRFVIKPQSTFAYEGQTATFWCMISSNSPFIVSWFKEQRELKQSVKFMKRYTVDNNYTFVVNRCKMNDFGEYIIRAENQHGGREEPVFLDVRKRPVDFTPVHLEPMRKRREPTPAPYEEEPDCPPKFSFLLRPRIIQAGQALKLICCLKAKPTPQITWLKDGRELAKTDYTIKHADGVVSLEIVACETSHTGKYTCLAKNGLGEDKTTADVLIEGRRTFTPAPLITTSDTTSDATLLQMETELAAASGRPRRSASLSRSVSPAPNRSGMLLSPTGNQTNLTATLYSPNYSINTNRHLRHSYKAPNYSLSSLPLSRQRYTVDRSLPRFPRSNIRHFRTLSSFGRSSSSLH